MHDTDKIDFVRSRKDTAKILNVSERTLSRMEAMGKAPRRTQISERCHGFRQSHIDEFLNGR
jgi:predicted DNA-binding transcriptional regulator AlpA